MKEKLEAFRALVEAQQKERMIAQGFVLAKHGDNYAVSIKPKQKYTYVDIGKVGETDNRNDEWFGLHAAKKARVHDLCEQERKEQAV